MKQPLLPPKQVEPTALEPSSFGQKVAQLFHKIQSPLGTQLRSIARQEAGQAHTEVMQSLTDAIFDASQELKDSAGKIGKGLLIEEIGNLMADEALMNANQAVIDEVKQSWRPVIWSWMPSIVFSRPISKF